MWTHFCRIALHTKPNSSSFFLVARKKMEKGAAKRQKKKWAKNTIKKEFLCFALLICDVIKQNESELANTLFRMQPNKADSFFCFLLFVQSFNCLYLWNQLPNLWGFHQIKA